MAIPVQIQKQARSQYGVGFELKVVDVCKLRFGIVKIVRIDKRLAIERMECDQLLEDAADSLLSFSSIGKTGGNFQARPSIQTMLRKRNTGMK